MNLAHRRHRLGLLTDWQARTAYIQLGRMGYRDGEPKGIERETSQILSKVFSALRDEGVWRADVAKEHLVPTDELLRATFGLTVAQDPSPGSSPRDPAPPHARPQLHGVE